MAVISSIFFQMTFILRRVLRNWFLRMVLSDGLVHGVTSIGHAPWMGSGPGQLLGLITAIHKFRWNRLLGNDFLLNRHGTSRIALATKVYITPVVVITQRG